MSNEIQNEDWEERDIIMKEIKLDLEEDLIEKIIEIAKVNIINDRQELINYGINMALRDIIDSNGECLKEE